MRGDVKVLQIAAADATVKKLLIPLIDRLASEGYQVHIACSDGKYVPELEAGGHTVWPIPIDRRLSPFSNVRSLWRLFRLMRRERFDAVHVHTPVAAALGRVAAWAARVPVVVYTAHGFYFHENMSAKVRRPLIWMERLLCRVTDLVLTQSQEDALSAVREGISSPSKVRWIGNGIDTQRFATPFPRDSVREKLGLRPEDKVVGFVGRIVREKGIVDLVKAMEIVARKVPEARLLLVGDTLDSDRDRTAKEELRQVLDRTGLASRVVSTGFVEDVAPAMSAMDVFVLPSYREGMPRTILEAMASGKPVVATNIRGCREEVVDGVTGLIVPIKDPSSLGAAIVRLLAHPEKARQMGAEGRRRAADLFDESVVLDRQVSAYEDVITKRFGIMGVPRAGIEKNKLQLLLKRCIDLGASLASLAVLGIPLLLIAALVRVDSEGPALFRQERIGRAGRPFRICKFRTMVDDSTGQSGGPGTGDEHHRVTRVGRLLREWSLDELPQLINVLRGEMSIVGPRPTLRYQVERYDDFQRQRLLAKPGITSWAAVNGRNLLSWSERIKLDVWYVRNWSLWLDIKIVARTVWVTFGSRRGIYGPEGVNDDFVSSALLEQGRRNE